MEKNEGFVFIVICVGIMIVSLAAFRYNTYISVTKEKIEIQTQDSNLEQEKVIKKIE